MLGGKHVTHQVGQGNARGERKLVQANQLSARLGRCQFGDIDRRRDRGKADGDAQQCACYAEHPDIGSQRREDGAGNKQDRSIDQRSTPADAIGDAAADHRPQHDPQ